jgi:glyoxylate/hydroxypyruvate reductase A
MRVLFAYPNEVADPWLVALRLALPDIAFSVWNPSGPPVGADAALVWRPPKALFEQEPTLKVIFNLGAGVDALLATDIPAAIRIVRLEDAGMALQMAEYAAFALARLSRDFDFYEANQKHARWQPARGTPRSAWPVGVLGLGAIGRQVADTLAALGYDVRGWSRTPRQLEGIDTFAGAAQWPDFLARTRVLINVLPLTDETRDLIDHRCLSQLLPGAHVINVGRGETLVEEDLLSQMESGHVAGATLDVFRTEPLPADHPFWRDRRIYITPHVAARTLRIESIAQIVENLKRLLRGETLRGVVDRERGY